MIKIVFLSFLLMSLSGCAQNISPNTYESSEVGVASRVVSGTVVAKRRINIDNSNGVGGLAGATAGAAAGSLAGGDVATVIVGAVGGAVVGGIAGNGLDKAVNQHQGFEYIIKLKNKSVVSIVQAQDLNLSINQHILIIYGATTRIIPDSTSHA